MEKEKLEIEISILDEKVIEESFYITMKLKEGKLDYKSSKKIRAQIKIFIILFSLYLFFYLGMIILLILERNFINILLNSGVFAFFLFYYIKLIKGYAIDRKNVKSILKAFSNYTLIFDNKGIKQKKKTSETNLCDWKQLKSILINEYSIIFLSNNNDALLYISTYYKEKITDILTKLHKEQLIVDNYVSLTK